MKLDLFYQGSKKLSQKVDALELFKNYEEGTDEYARLLRMVEDVCDTTFDLEIERNAETFYDLLDQVASSAGYTIHSLRGGPTESHVVLAPSELNSQTWKDAPLVAFTSTSAMTHREQSGGECLLAAFSSASRSTFLDSATFELYNQDPQSGLSMRALRLVLESCYKANPELPQIILAVREHSWAALASYTSGVFLLECVIKMHGTNVLFPHTIALDVCHGVVSDSMRSSLVPWNQDWKVSPRYTVQRVDRLHQLMVRQI